MSVVQVVVDGVVKMTVDGTLRDVAGSATPPIVTPPVTTQPPAVLPGLNPPVANFDLWVAKRWSIGDVAAGSNISAVFNVPADWPTITQKLFGTPMIEISPSGFYNGGLQMLIDGKPYDQSPIAHNDPRVAPGRHVLTLTFMNATSGSLDFYH